MTRRATSSLYAWAVTLALLVAGFGLSAGHLRHALLVYLASWLFALGVVLGSIALLLIHALTGGEWGRRLGQEWLAAIRLFPCVGLAVLPLLIGMRVIFPWLQTELPEDPYLDQQRWYLNAPALIARTIVLFAIWAWIAVGVTRAAGNGQAIGPRFAALGLVAMLLTNTLAAVDWVMSLVPRWHTTDMGLLLFTSQLLAALALAVLLRLSHPASSGRTSPRLLHDFGNLILALVLGWAYVSFIDYLTSWVADLPAETAWYMPRLHTSWWWLGIAVACLGLGLPFLALLMGKTKASARGLCAVALVILFAQWLDLVWLVLPSGTVQGFSLRWSDPLICTGLLGSCALCYRAGLRAVEGVR